ncbi:uncharacterized protein YFR016C isoform X1 [Aedes aegypti]|uniref:RIIa domain-containing protein n=2 Tax=Aedes aegypti TaxID=7159 RepID=A0A1S4F2S8_AEDAE|nr:uncharacterized protein YFR016C isoform X1 [Aedes aegypti]
MPITTPKVPEGLPELMKGLAKSVIKENPENIYVHAAEYFENLIRERDGDLDRGYRNFSAYKVYADYKEKCRGRGECLSAGSGGDVPSSAGAMAVRGKMASDGDDDSGGSASATRGRRKKRVRKQGSKESNRSLEKQDSVGSTTEGVNGEEDEKKPSSANSSLKGDLGAIKEDSPDIEQAMVKVEAHLEDQAPRKRSINKSVSVDSAAAVSAVSSVLQDAVEDADDADRETGEAIETQVEADLAEELGHPINCEDVDSYPPDEDGNGEDYGSAPSTAEVGGEVLGEADMLVDDAPPTEVADNVEKKSDEVDLSVNGVEEKTEEPVMNGSVEVKSGSPVKGSIEKQDSGEAQSEGIDTVDEPVPVVEEVEESVPNLPDVPTEEPSAEIEEADTEAEAAQVEPNVEEPNDEEKLVDKAQEETIEDANVIETSKESSVDKLDEASVADEATKEETAKEDVAEQESPSDKTDAAEEASQKEEGSEPSPTVESESKDNGSEAAETSPKQAISVEENANTPSNADNEENPSKEDDQIIASKEGLEEKSEEPSPVSGEDPVVGESQEEPVGNEESNNETQSLEGDQSDAKLETENGNVSGELVENPPENSESNENVSNEKEDSTVENPSETKESNGNPDEASPIKSNSMEQNDEQSAPEDVPPVSNEPETDVQPEDAVQKNFTGSDSEVQPNGSTQASKEPSVEQSESEKNASLDEPKSSGSPKASKEPSLDKPEPEVNADSDQVKSSASAKASKEASLDEPEAEQNASLDEPKSSGSLKASKEPSLEVPESEVNVDSEQPKSSASAKASKEPSLDEPEPEINGELDQPKSSGSAKSSKEPSLDKPDPEKDEPKSSGSAKASKEPSLEQGGSAEASREPSLDKSESELNQSLDRSNGDQSKESSAKESAGESGSAEEATGRDEGGSPADGGEVSISSRMGDVEQELESVSKDAEVEGHLEEDAAAEEPSAPPMQESGESKAEDDVAKGDGSMEAETKQDSEEVDESKKEVVEEPCIQRQVSPSTSKIPSKQPSVELEDIKKVDLTSLNKDSAEALFYTLKKSELENQATKPEAEVEQNEEEKDDDADVVVTEEPPPPVSRQSTKRSFTDDFLENSPITEEASKSAEGDGVADNKGADEDENQVFNPMLAASVRNKQLQDQLHSRYSQDDMSKLQRSPRKAAMHRSMTERVDLAKQSTNYVDLRKYDPDYVEEEDQFDGYYIGNLRNKILASSVSVADSDYYDPEQVEGSLDDNNVQTALQTIASTDTESTLPSQITVQANKGFLKRGSQNTSSNIPYSSFGNNAINQSLDDFIEREEQMKEAAEAQAASTIQRSYRRFRTNKKKLLRDYHSTMQTFTEDQSTESLEDYPSSVIQIKLDRKQQEESDNSFEDARSENRRRPMYSLNIDEYDTAARRMTLTRGVAMQRNSTPEEDSGKSDEKKSASDPASTLTITEESPRTSSDLSSEEKKSSTSSDEKENKDNSSSKSSGGKTSAEESAVAATAQNDGRKSASLDVQKLFIARQRTMPVQIETTVMRAQPKHLRKRIKSAGMIRK